MQNVKIDRNKYIGGSDIPIIMNISPFKTRFDLLLEKAELQENEFDGNDYTEFGNIMEPKIRDYINNLTKRNFIEGKHINGDIRVHTDGEDDEIILEIKTTSQVHEDVNEYKIYLVQLLFYMKETKKEKGILAVYNRPKDFNEEFDSDKLQIFEINISDYEELINQIYFAVNRFREDLIKIKQNPLLREEDLLPNEIIELSNQVEQLELNLQSYNELVKKYDKFKEDLRLSMNKYGIKKWITPNGTQITLISDTPDKEITEEYYDEEKFISENEELYKEYTKALSKYKYTRNLIKKGKRGSVRITLKN